MIQRLKGSSIDSFHLLFLTSTCGLVVSGQGTIFYDVVMEFGSNLYDDSSCCIAWQISTNEGSLVIVSDVLLDL